MPRIIEPIEVLLPRGGSGEGITGWTKWGTGCLIAQDLSRSVRLPLGKATTIGSMVHAYLEMWRSGKLDPDAQAVSFCDDDGIPVEAEWQAEALRLFDAYREMRAIDHHGPVLATELHLSGPEVETALGVSPYTAQIDLLAGTKDDCVLVDYKTAAASGGGRYTGGAGKLQMHAYYLATRAAGYRVTKIMIEQITKTKTVKVNDYEIELPTPGQIRKLRKYLQFAKHRRATGSRDPLLPFCDSCDYRYHGHCAQ